MSRWRPIVLIASVALLGFLRLDLPSIHYIVEGTFSRLDLAFIKLPMAYKLAAAFLPALFFGRVFCGNVCPKGAAQELLFSFDATECLQCGRCVTKCPRGAIR